MPKDLFVWLCLAIVINLLLIFFHMLGHFLTSKVLKANLAETSYGIGPKLFRFLKTSLVFKVPIIYCEEHIFKTSSGDTHKSGNATAIRVSLFLRRTIVLVAGPLISFAVAVCVFAYIGSMGTSILLPVIGEIRSGSPAEKAGLRQGDSVISVGNISISSWNELASKIGNSSVKPLPIQIMREDEVIKVILYPEVKVTKSKTLFQYSVDHTKNSLLVGLLEF